MIAGTLYIHSFLQASVRFPSRNGAETFSFVCHSEVAMAGASVQCVVWEWERDDGGFSPYPPDMSSQIEEAYSTGTGSYTMVDYTVHFSRMIQKKHNTGIVNWPRVEHGRENGVHKSIHCLSNPVGGAGSVTFNLDSPKIGSPPPPGTNFSGPTLKNLFPL